MDDTLQELLEDCTRTLGGKVVKEFSPEGKKLLQNSNSMLSVKEGSCIHY